VERLWTPWRMTYVTGQSRGGCVFCDALAAEDDTRMLIIHRGERCFIILNLYPYNAGHVMVVPYQHVASLEDVDAATRSEMFELASLAVETARSTLRCEGFNLGMNLGENAGAGVAHHIHLHVVPRWTGDANFMPIIGNTMVMPELLPVTYARLRAGLEGLIAKRRDGAVLQAGALVVLPSQRAVLLRRAADGNIVVPKGHIEPGESAAETAVRELLEETSVAIRLAGWAGNSSFDTRGDDGHNERRCVVYFLATGDETPDLALHHELDTLLVPIEQAASQVSIPALRDMIHQATPAMLALCGEPE
jgi:ATP adenylyltransferase